RQRTLHGALLNDVREPHERATCMAEGARGIAQGDILREASTQLPALDREILLFCQSGKRSMDAARALLDLGYTHIASVHGGA
ncbi:rhodanese-like domain-containing protein, partial [Stenotrophomonas sp. SrG]|uniref:rhodanese-like domain-containing protein n=1 Tax=Stenotrophomonas sp. SrG TaxID=3414430 RepID=UPI003CE8C4CB